jgi:phage terminase large subunit
MSVKPNPNLTFLIDAYNSGKRGVLLEGSSRSGKTFSGIDFIVWLCSTHDNLTITIVKETLASFRTTLYSDFDRRLPAFGLPSPFMDRVSIQSFTLFNSRINLLGADSPDKVHGASCDFLFVNEGLDVSQPVFDQLEMRCRKFFWIDYNPKTTTHWIFDAVETRPDVALFRSTFKDNPFISEPEKQKILSYEPTTENIERGTADEHMWRCYGLGLRSAPEGLVFPIVEWIDEFPTDIDRVYYGSDIGLTSASTFVKMGVEGENMYVECLAYQPTPSVDEYMALASTCVTKNDIVWCDSAAPAFILAARMAGYKFYAVRKFPGSRKSAIGRIKSYRIHLVRNRHYQSFLKEQTSFVWRTVNGIQLDEPIDGNDHIIDAWMYCALSGLRE